MRLAIEDALVLVSSLLAIARPASAAATFFRWLRHLGGPGLILLGILDNSMLPLPGSMDVFVVVLSGGQRLWWPYYAFMATAGAVLGGYLTYRLARREGKERLAKRLKRSQMEKVHRAFDKWGFWAVAVPALIPPPFPMTPFLLAAGATQYSWKKFIGALILGRGVRYTVISVVTAFFGRAIISYFGEHARFAIWILIALLVAGGALALLRVKFHRSKHA